MPRFHLPALFAILPLSACATLESGADHARDFARQHPVVTAVAVGVVAGSIVAAVDHHHHQRPARSDAGACVVIVQTLEGPVPEPCH